MEEGTVFRYTAMGLRNLGHNKIGEPPEPRYCAVACSGGKLFLSRAGEAYDARESANSFHVNRR